MYVLFSRSSLNLKSAAGASCWHGAGAALPWPASNTEIFTPQTPQCWKERKDDAAITDAFYGAPTAITLSAPKDFLFSREDCVLAAENMMLAADSLGIGSCYIGPGWTAFADPYGQEILRRWEIRTDYYAVMQLLLGYPRASDPHPTPKPRKNDRIMRSLRRCNTIKIYAKKDAVPF